MAGTGVTARSGVVISAAVVFAIFFMGDSSAERVVLVSIDGMRPAYVMEADRHGLRVPTLRRLLREGTYAEAVIGVTPTRTYPSHTTIITGVSPLDHGVVDNDPRAIGQKDSSWTHWRAADIKVPTLWDAAHQAGLVTASVSWPITVAAGSINYCIPDHLRRPGDDDRLADAVAKPDGLLERLAPDLGPYTNEDTEDGDAARTRYAIRILRENRPSFMTVALASPDWRAHFYGPSSPRANAALEAVDGMVAELHEAALAIDPKTVLIVLSDHGMTWARTRVNLRPAFVEAGFIVLADPDTRSTPTVRTWTADVKGSGGLAFVRLKEPQDSDMHGRVVALLERLRMDSAYGIDRILTQRDFPQLRAYPGTSFVVAFKPGYYMRWDESPRLGLPPNTPMPVGFHGYLPHNAEMHAAFMVHGKSIARGRSLGVVDMEQIAPTVASILGVRFATARRAPLRVLSSEQVR